MSGHPNPAGAPKPVTLSRPGVLSAADYAQLSGLTFDEKVRQTRAILTEVQATRTQQQSAQFGRFDWEEAVGPAGEVLFIGQGAPATTTRPTVIVIQRNGEVWRMLPSGLRSVISHTFPKTIDYDLQLGQGKHMAT